MDISNLEKGHFEMSETAANYLLGLVLEGKKRATSSSLWAYEIEGEDDTLESWQKTHQHFFEKEGKVLGYTFSEEMPVVFEEFEVIEVL